MDAPALEQGVKGSWCWRKSSREGKCQLTGELDLGHQRILTPSPVVEGVVSLLFPCWQT